MGPFVLKNSDRSNSSFPIQRKNIILTVLIIWHPNSTVVIIQGMLTRQTCKNGKETLKIGRNTSRNSQAFELRIEPVKNKTEWLEHLCQGPL